ncbi:DUF120 domain-containing protein [Chloroflexota bacterium]
MIKGKVTEGLKESSSFTELPWVREQFITKLDITPYPGTLNLEIIDTGDLEKLEEIKRRTGINIVPAVPGLCSAKCFPVMVYEKVKGALIIPQVPDYPQSKMELISSNRIRDILSLNVGDVVEVKVI